MNGIVLVFYYCIGKKTAHSGVVKKSRTEHFCSIRLGTGVFEELPSLTQARAMADEYRHMIDRGMDPLTHKRERKLAMRGDKVEVLTVSMLIDEALPVIEGAKRWKNAKHAAQWHNTLHTYVVPVIGNMSVNDVERDDVLKVLKPIWETKSETAGRLRGRLEAIFGYAIATGKRSGANPATWRSNLDLFLPPLSKVKTIEHHDAVTVKEVRSVFSTIWNPPKSTTAAAIIFGTLTCARCEEFMLAKWSEIDFKEALQKPPCQAGWNKNVLFGFS